VGEDPYTIDLIVNLFIEGTEDFRRAEGYIYILANVRYND